MNTTRNSQSIDVINSPAENAKRNFMSDLRHYDNQNSLVAVVMDDIQVTVTWNHGGLSHFHHGWLRENCPSTESRHPSSMERLIQPSEISLTIKPEQVELSEEGFLVVTWPLLEGKTEQHKSTFHPGWLQSHCYSSDKRSSPSNTYKERPKTEAVYEWSDVMECDSALLECLIKLEREGWLTVARVPDEDGACVRFAKRIGVIRSSNFGYSFDVRSIPNPNSNAYTSLRLPLHTDMPHYELPPGVQLLHCRSNSASGGESLLSDGLAVAQQLKQYNPDAYNLLTSETIPYRFQDDSSDYSARHPVIECDHSGIPIYINWSNSTSAPLDTPYSRMSEMRKSIKLFVELLEHPQNLITKKLVAGEMIVFNNRRILHGRNAFNVTEGERHLQGCYLETSELKSRLAVLSRNCR